MKRSQFGWRSLAAVALIASLSSVGCGVEQRDGLAQAIAADIPVLDGSTSTQPLRMFVVCELLDIDCDWLVRPDGSQRVWLAGGDAADEDLAARLRDTVPSSGTHGSYVALAEGAADLIFTARLPSSDELALAESNGVAFEILPIALDAFVFLVNETNVVNALDLDQVRAIFSGSVTNWSEVGGSNLPIQPYTRNETSGSQVLMTELVMGEIPMVDAPNLMLPTMVAPFDAISHDENGISYSVYYFATQMMPANAAKLLRIDGVAPTSSTISSGAYPLVTEVYAVIDASSPDDDTVRVLLQWLETDQGRRAIGDSGYVPIPGN